MKKAFPKRILAWLLIATLTLSLAACSSQPEPTDLESDAVSEAASDLEAGQVLPAFLNPLPIPTSASAAGVVNTGFRFNAQEMHEKNSDTVGWLNLPNSELDDVVVWYPSSTDKFYYLRRDFNKVPNTGPLASQYGTYFADWRSTFSGGGRGGMSRNTTIYGHSMEDNASGAGFSQLKKYLSEDFARENPYIYFSTVEEDMAWEVFAVFYATVFLDYNKPDHSDSDFSEMIGECLKRSVYNYDTEISASDKILTLSTCCYNYTTSYPNNYRYVVMAKLVKPGQPLKKEASFTKNPSPKAP